MKRTLALLLAAVLLLSGCGNSSEEESATPKVSTTLMIYMIGSDLEAKSGLASGDLEELAGSNINLEQNRVVVFAGGSKKWHNDALADTANAVLELKNTGFEKIQTVDSVSMGEASSLSYFLNYCASNYDTERYALVLWNHGSGPVMGYGYDELHKADSLLLSEMAQALKDSSFGDEKKLEWVGFDACLMASAELMSVWDDYAHYLVASQEIEPAFGWDYSVFSGIDSADTKGFLGSVGDAYMAACKAYYEKKGFDQRDTTLSCVDLSQTAQMEQAVNAMFKKATADLVQDYNRLAIDRVKTRALGRASTGSEYDLVDLKDLAVQMKASYPQEAEALMTCIDNLMVYNKNNTVDCCGLSLYYPFYNKAYNEHSWQEIYSNLGVFPEYQSFLEQYRKTWLRNDNIEEFAAKVLLEEEKAGTYVMPLTKEQNDSFAEARYYILRQETKGIFNYVYVSPDVSHTGSSLKANFDGRVLYVKNQAGHKFVLPSVYHDKVGEYTRYTATTLASNDLPQVGAYMNGETEHRSASYSVQLSANSQTGTCAISAMIPLGESADDQTLRSGKIEDVDLSEWSRLSFLNSMYYYLTRDKNGVLLPLDQWTISTMVSGEYFYLSDGLEFALEPVADGKYYVLIEARDIQGNAFCSELFPIEVSGDTISGYEEPALNVTEVSWKSGQSVLLGKENGVTLRLGIEEGIFGGKDYRVEVKNTNDFPVMVQVDELLCNDIYRINASSDAYGGKVKVEAGETGYIEDLDLEYTLASGDIRKLKSLQMKFGIRNGETNEWIIADKVYRILTSTKTTLPIDEYDVQRVFPTDPLLGAKAETQVLHQDDKVKITLFGLGEDGGVCRVENLSNEELTLYLQGIAINDYCSYEYSRVVLPAGMAGYLRQSIYGLDKVGITAVSKVQMLFSVNTPSDYARGESNLFWCDVKLSSRSKKGSTFQEEDTVIYEENGIRVAISKKQKEGNNGSYDVWGITLYNDTDDNISVFPVNVSINGVAVEKIEHPLDFSLFAGPHQYGCDGVGYYYEVPLKDVKTITFNIQIRDYLQEEVLFTSEEVCTIKP